MAPLVKRRLTPVEYAKHLLDAIISIRQQKQIPNFDRISKFLHRSIELTPRKCKEHLNNAVSDGFIVEYTALGVKGQRTGLEQEGYKIPLTGEVEEIDDGHDWYCFECHSPGEVYQCNSCFRVYHQGCTREDTSGEFFTCSVCWASRKKNKMRKKMLNTLLSYTILHLKEKMKELYKVGWKTHIDDQERFVYKKMDLYKMEEKVQASHYKCLEEFHADARTILHNCTLIYGEDKGGIIELASIMVKACKYDMDEIALCPNCYYMSNAKPEDWFCQPCNPPHDLVFAKQKGYSYWPAKVVQDLDGKYDVRFFGGWHQRAVIPAEYIKPITTDVKHMTIKKTAAFNKSYKELKMHQKYLDEREREMEATDGARHKEEEDEEDEGEEEKCEEAEEEEDQTMEEDEDEDIKESMNSSVSEDLDDYEEVSPKAPRQKIAVKKKEKSLYMSKKALKRQKGLKDEYEFEEEFDNRQVTSTSVERNGKKRKKNSSKQSSHDESIMVSSSVDKVTNSARIFSSSIAIQTTLTETEDTESQTDPLEEKAFKEEIEPDQIAKDDSSSKHDDQYCEDRMSTVIADLTQRLEEKFEEDKRTALANLSQQLEEDFGKDKQQAVERTIASMKLEVEKARKAGEESTREQYMEEMKKLAQKHKDAISQAKKKQWCLNCEEEAMYHCCWNTSYCSVKCQQEHWHKEHKRVCRRKRTGERN